MQLDLMRSWLKALVVLVALAAGFPSAAWAHAGHEHGTQAPVGIAVALDPVLFATDVGQPLRLDNLMLRGLDASATSPSPERKIAHPSKSAGDNLFVGLHGHLDAAPAGNPIQPLYQVTCCCGSVACHAGVDAPTLIVADPWTLAAKVESPPVPALAGAVLGGIERPPRDGIPL
jgi:hypothetical protein